MLITIHSKVEVVANGINQLFISQVNPRLDLPSRFHINGREEQVLP